MNLSVEYKSQSGKIVSQTHKLTRLAFAKHFGIAGQGYAPKPQKIIRTVSMFFHYSFYMGRNEFYLSNKFSSPPNHLSDPTEKSHFSNLAGKSIADFLSKRIDQSTFTVNYEAAMRERGMLIIGSRPDLIAFNTNSNSTFAIESKGYSGSYGDMTAHKIQSQSGAIPVNFSVACVSYNLYNQVRCKYYDPYNENIAFDNELLRGLSKKYYKGLSDFLDQRYFEYRVITVQNENFYEVDLPYRFFEKIFSREIRFKHFGYYDLFDFFRPRLILPEKILDYAENGITNEIRPFIYGDAQSNENIYIDNDRVGLRIGF